MAVWASSSQVGPVIGSAAPLPQCVLQVGQIVGRTCHGWVGVPVPLLRTLPGYRRWPVGALYPLVLGDFARVTVIESREFPQL